MKHRIFCLFVLGLIMAGTGSAGDERPAVLKTMMVSMSKNPEAGIRRAIMQGMRDDSPGIKTPYVDLDSNGGVLHLKQMQRVLILLPAHAADSSTWSKLEIGKPGIVALTMDDSVAHPKLRSPDGMPARRLFEIRADAPGETTISTRMRSGEAPVSGVNAFKMMIIVEQRLN